MTRLGKYEILEELGRGGFAVVYKARDTTLDRVVALKVLHPQLTTDPKFVQRFHQEARTAASFLHPHIVTIFEVGEEAGQHFLAMACLSGCTLDQLLTRGAMPPLRAVSILEQLAAALDVIHQKGLIHRDVKPGNVMVDDSGRATLLDFGIVRAAEGTRLTTTMAVLGTPEYMSPELAEGEEPEAKESKPVAAGEVVKVVAEHSQRAIVSVLRFLNDRDITLTSLEILEPNLESVFLHLTGKRLRE